LVRRREADDLSRHSPGGQPRPLIAVRFNPIGTRSSFIGFVAFSTPIRHPLRRKMLQSMIPKSECRFSEKIMLKQKAGARF
jgi:hypothetical protein